MSASARGGDTEKLRDALGKSLKPIASIIMIIAGGGAFQQMLTSAKVGDAIVNLTQQFAFPPLILGWLIAMLLSVSTGSATVAMTTACGIVAPIAAASGAAVRPELMVLATGAGSLILSHVNDGGFWLVKEYFNLTVPETFKTWTVLETIISVVALLLTLALSTVV